MQKIQVKITALLMLVVMLFSIFSSYNKVFALDIDVANLKTVVDSQSHIQFKFDSGWANVRSDLIGYTVGGKTYAAYCISHRITWC